MTRRGRKGAGPVLGVGGAQRAGPNAAGVLVLLSKHTFCIRFHSLCQRNCEQVRLVHLIVIAVPVPQIQEQIVEVILGVVVRLHRHERQHGWTCPQPPGAEC